MALLGMALVQTSIRAAPAPIPPSAQILFSAGLLVASGILIALALMVDRRD
jgi:hypothetical protein